jgi:catechol-2,3-dioxygenase
MSHGIRVSTVNVSSSDPGALAHFWARLLDLDIITEQPEWVVIGGKGSVPIAFELDRHYQPPVWPTEPGSPPTQMHLEVQVDDLEGALAHALECGARLADHQPQDDVRVCLDPAGHPFCLWIDESGENPAAG